MQRPKVTPRQGIYQEENQKIHIEFQHLFKADHSRSCIVSLRVSFLPPIVFAVGRLVLHLGHSHLIRCDDGDIGQQINRKSSLQIIYT